MEPTLHPILVDGEPAAAVSGATLDVVDPATGTIIGQIPRCDERDVEVAVAAAKRAAPGWRAADPQMRAAALNAFADAVAERGDELARLDSLDNGSPLHEMRNDIGLATSQLRYMAGLALEVRGRTMPETPGRLQYTVREPFGVTARIIAFNHPLMFAATKIAAPLLAGQPGDSQAVGVHLAVRPGHGAGPGAAVPAGRGAGADRARCRGGRRAGPASRHPPGRVHRQRRHRPPHPGQRGRGRGQDGHARAGRQEPDRGLR